MTTINRELVLNYIKKNPFSKFRKIFADLYGSNPKRYKTLDSDLQVLRREGKIVYIIKKGWVLNDKKLNIEFEQKKMSTIKPGNFKNCCVECGKKEYKVSDMPLNIKTKMGVCPFCKGYELIIQSMTWRNLQC